MGRETHKIGKSVFCQNQTSSAVFQKMSEKIKFWPAYIYAYGHTYFANIRRENIKLANQIYCQKQTSKKQIFARNKKKNGANVFENMSTTVKFWLNIYIAHNTYFSNFRF